MKLPMFAAAAVGLLVGCLDVEETITIYPDGSGRVIGKTVFGEHLSTFLDMAARQGNRELEQSVLEGAGFTGEDIFLIRSEVKKDGKTYRAEFTALCRDIARAIARDSQSPTPPCRMQKEKDGTFVFLIGDEQEPAEGAPVPTGEEEIEMTKSMLKDFRVVVNYVLPGEITRLEGPSEFVSHQGRTVTISIDVDRLVAWMKQGNAAAPRRIKVTCAAPSADVEAEWKSFRAELEQAVRDAKNR